jgi:recombination protein RecA
MAKKEEKLSWEETLKKLDKDYGKGSVIHGSDIEKCNEVVSTGSLGLDIALGIGGLPATGKVIEAYGWESSGKSTLAQKIMGNFQKAYPNKKVILVDGEFATDEKYAKTLGVNLNELVLIQIDEHAGEGAYNKAQALIDTGEVSLVVYDSYNSLKPKKIIDGEIGEHNLGLHARMMDTVVNKASANGVKYGTTSLFIGQLREKIGVMFGSPETTQGGNALRFYADIRLRVARSLTTENSVMDGKEKIGNQCSVKVEKTKFGAPFKKAEFNIIYGEGIDKYGELIEIGHEVGVFKKYGESITVGGEKQPIATFITLLQDNDELFQKYRTDILNKTIYKHESKDKEIVGESSTS